MTEKVFTAKDSVRVFALAVGVSLLFQTILAAAGVTAEGVLFWIVNGLYGLLLCAAAVGYSLCTKKNFRAAFTVTKPPLSHLFLELAAIFFLLNAMTIVNEAFCDFIEWTGLKRPSASVTEESVSQYFLLALLIAGVLAPLFEETVFRGAVANGFANGFSPVAAIFLSGAMFALFHMNAAQTLHQFALGCLLALFMLRSGSLWTAAIGHVFNNLCAIFLSLYLEPSGFYGRYPLAIALVSFLCVAAMVTIYLTRCKSRRVQRETRRDFGATDVVLLVFSLTACLVLWTANLLA